MRKQAGFTLVELVVVIAVLGILAATALPRFVNVQSSALRAAGQGLQGSMRSAANLARASWVAAGSTGSTVTMDTATVAVSSTTGWPTAAGITSALQDTAGFTEATAGSGSYSRTSGACTITVAYDPSNGNATLTPSGTCT